MTSRQHVYLTVNSYLEALESASRLITFEMSHQVAIDSRQRTFAMTRTLKYLQIKLRFRKQCSLTAD
jgi:hypothetical protein